MNHRQVTLLPSKSFTANFVETVDFRMEDAISALWIQYKGLNNGSTPTEHPAKLITKVEIIDGGFVIASLNGFQAEALQYWVHGVQPLGILNYVDNEYCATNFVIPFGRWLYDEDFALDPKRFKNPQIRITGTLADGGSAPDAGILEVVAMAFDDKKINPPAYLRNIAWRSYSLVASGNEIIDLPTDDVIKMIMVQSIARTKQPWQQFNSIKLSENSDSKIPYDQNVSDLIKYLHLSRSPITEHIRAVATGSSVDHYITPSYEQGLVWTADNGAAVYPSCLDNFGGSVGIKGSGAGNVAGIAHGYCPHGSLAIPFGDDWTPSDWYDARSLKSLRLRITAGSGILASSTCEVVLQSAHKY